MTARRPALLAAALGLVVLVNYGVHRVRPRLQELRAGDEARQRLAADTAAAPSPAALAAAQDGVAALEDEIASVSSRLAALEARVARAEDLPELRLALADAAAGAGLVLEAEEPLGADGRRTSLTLRGAFGALHAFLERVEALPSRVVVSDLELELPKDDARLVIRMKVTL